MIGHTSAYTHSESKAFEYSKRSFAKKYGSEVPVWALLASGATGGVCIHVC
jgi:solute carrier family 25 (mitochondrial carnitine/acylcarnitine transporter), member 20/29